MVKDLKGLDVTLRYESKSDKKIREATEEDIISAGVELIKRIKNVKEVSPFIKTRFRK